MKRKTLSRIFFGIAALLLLAALAFVAWASTPLGPDGMALSFLDSSESVRVEQNGAWISFAPRANARNAALIFYPGGRVDYRSYAPPLRLIAEQGYPVYLVRMPLNLAVFGVERAGRVIAAHPEIEHWAVGGHSLGGAMAAAYAHDHPGEAQGLALWASYPAENTSLAGRDLQVVSVYGGLDGIATPRQVLAARPLLPEDTAWVIIPGGIHSYFGSYGLQPGDGETAIPEFSQWHVAANATVEMLEELSGSHP